MKQVVINNIVNIYLTGTMTKQASRIKPFNSGGILSIPPISQCSPYCYLDQILSKSSLLVHGLKKIYLTLDVRSKKGTIKLIN